MKLFEILAQCREELDDVEPDYLWSDATLINHINEAQREAARRARLLVDSSSDICTILVTAGTALYALSPKIIRTLSVMPSWDTRPLVRTVTQEMDMRVSNWRAETNPRPTHVLFDFESGKLRLYPTPSEDGSLNLRVYRIPLTNMTGDNDEPEIKEVYHDKLVHWVCHRAYLKPDSDTYNKNASLEALAAFEREFGARPDARAEEFEERNLIDDLAGAY